jgi:hypothetical protein
MYNTGLEVLEETHESPNSELAVSREKSETETSQEFCPLIR